MRPEDIARLLNYMPSNGPVGAAPVAPAIVQPNDDGGRLEGAAPAAPAPYGFPDTAPKAAAPQAPAAPMRVPMPPDRPPEFSAYPEADLPVEGAKPIMVAPQLQAGLATAPTREEPGFLDKAAGAIRSTDGLLTSIGMGLMTTPGFGPAVGVGLNHHQTAQKARVATDLAQAELALKQRKLQQEAGALQGNAQILKRAFPDLSDPEALAAGSNTSLVTEALKIVRDPNHGRENDPSIIRARAQAQAEGAAAGQPQDVYGTETDEAGNTWSVNRRTGQRTVALQRQEDKSVSMVPEDQRVRLGLPSGSYQRDANGKVSAVNQAGTTINMGAEKAQDATVGKGYGEYQLDLATKGRNAGSTLNTLALMEQAMKTPGFYSGVGGEGIKRANQFLGALGVKDPRAASAAEVFDALSNKVVLDGLGGSLGPGISNTDRDYISRTAPTLAQSEQGNRDLIGVARKLAQRQQDVARLAREYAGKNQGRLDAGFDQVLDEYATANPLFPLAREGASASARKEPPQGAPAGARQAGDGMWYVPDPKRPGKYLKVQ